MYRLIFIISCFWYAPARAETYIVVSQNFNYYPHYNFKAKLDKGFIWAVLEEFSVFSGHKFVYRHMPVLRLQKELEKGTIDLIYPDNPLFNNEQNFAKGKYYSDTIVNTIGVSMVKKSRLTDDANTVKKLAIPLGFTPQLGWTEKLSLKQIMLAKVSTPLVSLKLLNLGRVDAAEVDYFVGQHLIRNNPELSKLAFHSGLPHSTVEFKLSTINQPQLIDEINHFMASQPHVIKKLMLLYGITPPELISQKLKEIN